MKYTHPLFKGTLLSRRNRFLAEIILDSGEHIVAHCPNTGSMKGVLEVPQEAWVLYTPHPQRKLSYTLIALKHNNTMVGVHTLFPNKLVQENIATGFLSFPNSITEIKTEQKYGTNSRIDLLLTDTHDKLTYLEVKNVSMTDNQGTALFPDAVTDRGTKHLHELIKIKQEGHSAMMCFVVQRDDVISFRPAEEIDPVYAKTLREAQRAHVEIRAYNCSITEDGIQLKDSLDIIL